jgi:hypothetical protein
VQICRSGKSASGVPTWRNTAEPGTPVPVETELCIRRFAEAAIDGFGAVLVKCPQ